jgi:hypothetical protein
MTVRLSALVCLGLVCPIALEGMARAAGESSLAAGIAGVLADSGSSGREVRRRAVEAIPLNRMGRAERQVAEQALQQTTLYRHLPAASITCDAGLLDFILTKPEALVDVWRVLGISRLALDPTAPGRWRLSDGYGTVGAVQLLHRERSDRGGLCVFHGRGAYDGPLAPKQLTGSCLVVVRYVAEPAVPGVCPRQTVQVDAFLDVDGVGLEVVTRTLQPLIVRSAATNTHEISLFVSQFAAAAARNPEAVSRLADRMTRTLPQDRSTLVALASGRRMGTPPASVRQTDDVQAELAARWMDAGQLDALQQR